MTSGEHIFFWSRHDKHGYLSNFWLQPIVVDGRTWPTSEHYYQAMKDSSLDYQEMIRSLKKPLEAKLAGYHAQLLIDWNGGEKEYQSPSGQTYLLPLKEQYMLKGLRAKFMQWPILQKLLLDTGDAELHEDSPWDKYWGYVHGEGKDRLGKLLMIVREEIKCSAKNVED